MRHGEKKPVTGVRVRENYHENNLEMSQAFVREGDDQWLSDVAPTVNALVIFLTRENNGIRVYEKEIKTDAQGRQVYVMSNGLSYVRDARNTWQIVE